jgi:hypothetical protein
VLYDFTAVEPGELSIKQGDRVASAPDDEGTVVQDDWIHVEHLDRPGLKGFVPVGYLEEIVDSEPQRKPAPQPPTRSSKVPDSPRAPDGEAEDTPSKATTAQALNVLSQSARFSESPRPRPIRTAQTTPRFGSQRAQFANTIQSQTLLSPGKAGYTLGMTSQTPRSSYSQTPKTLGRTAPPTFTGTPRVPNLSSSASTGDFEQLIKKNADYFERLKANRNETFTHLNEMVESLGKRLNESAQMCNDLVAQVGELDELIEAERRRWKQQLEMENTTGLISAAEDTRAI